MHKVTDRMIRKFRARLKDHDYEEGMTELHRQQLLAVITNYETLRKEREVMHEYGIWIFLNANDIWGWAVADACRIDLNEDWDKFLKVEKEWGWEGALAFMSLAEGCEPMCEMWKTEKSDKQKYLDAKQWIKDNDLEPTEESGWKSAAYEDKDAEIRRQKQRIQELENEVDWLEAAVRVD